MHYFNKIIVPLYYISFALIAYANEPISDFEHALAAYSKFAPVDDADKLLTNAARTYILDTLAEAKYTVPRETPALFAAATRLDTPMLEALLKGGAHPNIYDNFGLTPLMIAIMAYRSKDDFDSLATLVKWGANLEAQTLYSRKIHSLTLSRGETAFFLAFRFFNTAAMEGLVKIGAQIDAEQEDGLTPLAIAALDQNLFVIKKLIDLGANINWRHRSGANLVMLAVLKDRLKSIRPLAELGLSLDDESEQGTTALLLASELNNIKAIKTLARVGANVNFATKAGFTALHVAARYNLPEAIRELRTSGAELDTRDSNGATPLMLASALGNEAAVETLLGLGADSSIQNADGFTPFAGAYTLGHRFLAAKILWSAYGTPLLVAASSVVSGSLWLYRNAIGKWLNSRSSYSNGNLLSKIRGLQLKLPSAKALSKSIAPSPRRFVPAGAVQGEYSEQALQSYLEYEKEIDAERSDSSSKVHSIAVQPKATKAKSAPANKVSKAKKKNTVALDLPKTLLKRDIKRTGKFEESLQTLSDIEQKQIEHRIENLHEGAEARYGDVKYLHKYVTVRLPGGAKKKCPLYELKFSKGARVYFARVTRASILFLRAGDKNSQIKDIDMVTGKETSLPPD